MNVISFANCFDRLYLLFTQQFKTPELSFTGSTVFFYVDLTGSFC